MRRIFPTSLLLFIGGGLLVGVLGVCNLALFIERGSKSEPPSAVVASAPVALAAPRSGPTPLATAPAVLTSAGSSVVTHVAPETPEEWSFLYVVRGDLWATGGGGQFQLTQGAQISHPVVSDDAVAFVERQRNASDVWLASSGTPLRPVTQNTSPIISRNHWASQPVFVPGRQDLYVVGDFSKSSTGPGSLALWELNLQERAVVQITRPPEYAGGDQDVTFNPSNPSQIIFTRYSYAGTRLLEQLQWLDVTTRTLAALSPPDRPARQASYSPDGTAIAFVQAGQGTNQDLWAARIQLSATGALLEDPRQLASGVIANPVWSPDGSQLAYLALTGDQFQLWSQTMARDSNGDMRIVGQPRQVTNGQSVDATSRPVFMTRDQAARIRDWLTVAPAHS
jgi:hypothetical protein